MPRWIGHSPNEIGAIPGGIQTPSIAISWAQAVQLRRLNPRARIYAEINDTDRGGPGRKAKRWWNWYADAEDVLATRGVSASVRARADSARRREPETRQRRGRTLDRDEHSAHWEEEQRRRRQREALLVATGILDDTLMFTEMARSFWPRRSLKEWIDMPIDMLTAEIERAHRALE